MQNEILRYMGHSGEASIQLEKMISSCLEKLAAVSEPRHVMRQFPCFVSENNVTIDTFNIKSKSLTACLRDCTYVYLLAATLGADVDRLISQRSMADSAEALCLQACASAQIENYCNSVEQELSDNVYQDGLYLRSRYSPGYGDFNITCQTNVLSILNAHKLIGVTETKSHILTPLKSITAVIGVSSQVFHAEETVCMQEHKCKICDKMDCNFREKGFSK